MVVSELSEFFVCFSGVVLGGVWVVWRRMV